jgi:hypothetical protein
MIDLLLPDGTPLTVARWPNKHAEGGGSTHGWAVTGNGSNASGFGYPLSAPRLPSSTTDLFAAGYWVYDWADATIAVSALADGFASVPIEGRPLYVNETGKGVPIDHISVIFIREHVELTAVSCNFLRK